MRAADIVAQLAFNLPLHAGDFTTNVNVTTLTSAGGIATATTAAVHGLAVGSQVRMTGAQTPIPCSITRTGAVGTLVTTADHDITMNAGFDVQISGAVEPEFNGTFQLLAVPNRRTVKFAMPDAGALAATGAPLLLSGSGYASSYNGLVEVLTVPTISQFTYAVPSGLYSPAAGAIVAKTLPRISSGVSIERLDAAYTKQGAGKAWAFVVLGDAVADKSRHEDTDATANIQRGNYYNQRLIQSFDIFVFMPTSEQIAARKVRDRCEELLSPICRSLLQSRLPSLVENSNNPIQLSGHGMQAYNSAYYVHRYAFEAVLQLGESDVYVPTDDVAFRDISMTMAVDIGTGVMTSEIDLDEEPLP